MKASLRIKNEHFYAVVSYKSGNQNKQKWISLGLPVKNNKRKAEEMLKEIEQKYCDAEQRENLEGQLFVDYLADWLEKKKDYVEQSTWEGYKIYAEKHIIPYFEPMKLRISEIKPYHISDYYRYKFKSGRLDGKEGGLSISSIKKHGIVLKDVFNDAVINEVIPRNPASGVKLPGKDIPEREEVFLTADEANVMLRAFKGHPLEPLVYVTLYYGLRRSEALGLRWRAVDFEKRTLTINHTVVKNLSIIEKDRTKTASSNHTYELIDNVYKILLKRKEQQDKDKLVFGSSYKDNDYIFTWSDGTLFRPDYVTRGFQRVLNDHGLKPMRFHDLRHSTASVLFDMGWTLKDIQIWLRHSRIEVTGNIYTHISEDRKKSMANDINNIFTTE